MAAAIWDLAQNVKGVGYEINAFMYDGPVRKKQLKHHTEEEYREFLERLRLGAFDSYNTAAREMGWIE